MTSNNCHSRVFFNEKLDDRPSVEYILLVPYKGTFTNYVDKTRLIGGTGNVDVTL